MKVRPLPFQPSMVRAVLAGIKTQTRRAVRVQPGPGAHGCYRRPDGCWIWTSLPREANGPGDGVGISDPFRCPYGVPGDQLWVREAWRVRKLFEDTAPRDLEHKALVVYEADDRSTWPEWAIDAAGRLRPPMFMPRWASRIQLEVTDVRVERLQAISEADAIAEGIPFEGDCPSPRDNYSALWESINGPGSWDLNPWVWAVSFKRITP